MLHHNLANLVFHNVKLAMDLTTLTVNPVYGDMISIKMDFVIK